MDAHVGLIIVHHFFPIVTPAFHGLCLLSTPVIREGQTPRTAALGLSRPAPLVDQGQTG